MMPEESNPKTHFIEVNDNFAILSGFQEVCEAQGWKVQLGMGHSESSVEWGLFLEARKGNRLIRVQDNQIVTDHTKTQYKPKVEWGFTDREKQEVFEYFDSPDQLKSLLNRAEEEFILPVRKVK